ncbi:MAG: alanine--tRNA ligase [Candidatus Woesearchaeota archaeon]
MTLDMVMLSDKEQKKAFKQTASKNPDKYYPTSVLTNEGFERKKCPKCNAYYWTADNKEVCGDPQCQGGFSFIDESPARYDLDYIGVWEKFSKMFQDLGYTPIKRYPVVARWRDDTDFVQASIYNFQPHVVSGSIRPPANPLVVPQFSLRFNDIDNVGITGSHYTGFVMIGQHAFMPPKEWDQEKYFMDIHEWLNKGIGLSNKEISYQEDAWAGGGNYGSCIEFFSRGLELGNQVYMQYEQTPNGPRELSLKVLDMGMGQERNAWFTKGKTTSYEVAFPTVMKWLHQNTGIKYDDSIMKRFLHYSSLLNADEVNNMEEAWNNVAAKMSIDLGVLKENVKPASALYSIAEHTRTLLMAIGDGALPSNVGGGHNLRVILRRALSLKKAYGWEFDFLKLFELHAEYYKRQYEELEDKHEQVAKIIDVEIKRYNELSVRNKKIIGRMIKDNKTNVKDMITAYESHGITPDEIREEAISQGTIVNIPPNFYAELSENKTVRRGRSVDNRFSGYESIPLYYDDWKKTVFEATIIAAIGNDIVLDKTYYYPVSGGQMHDKGTINGHPIIRVSKEGRAIVHTLREHELTVGDKVSCIIDGNTRMQLTQHHSATHIIGIAAKRVLGDHIWQAGAEKRTDKARLDITHYQSLTIEEEKEIERISNDIIKQDITIQKEWMGRDEAEKKHGFTIYQGGAVPGDNLRIVRIGDIDVQACGGTHVDRTLEVGAIRIIRSTRISDGVVRIEFTAGGAAKKLIEERNNIIREICRLLECEENMIPGRCEELFVKWKKAKKTKNKEGLLPLVRSDITDNDILSESARILQTQEEHIIKTIRRFLKELQ